VNALRTPVVSQPVDQRDPSQPPDEETGDAFWHWVALVVLLGCWLAESFFNSPQGW
jgi:hypothetical protein